MGAASEVEGTNLDDAGAAFEWEGTERTIDEREVQGGFAPDWQKLLQAWWEQAVPGLS